MKGLNPFDFDIRLCSKEISAFEGLLTKPELKEREEILPFFRENPNLSAFIASYVPDIVRFNQLSYEFGLFGDFKTDIVVGDDKSNSYCLIEFEDASKDSIFKSNGRGITEWSDRYSHGFDQIIDWLWILDDFKKTSRSRAIFGTDNFKIHGILVIGRDAFISAEDKTRLDWRQNKQMVDSNKVTVLTFDQLYRDLKDRIEIYTLSVRT